MSTSKLFTPLRVGQSTLSHRLTMAPMTRLRASNTHTPLLPLVKDYYRQRASVPGSLLITEATVISPRHGGYTNVPGIYSEEQISAWKKSPMQCTRRARISTCSSGRWPYSEPGVHERKGL